MNVGMSEMFLKGKHICASRKLQLNTNKSPRGSVEAEDVLL